MCSRLPASPFPETAETPKMPGRHRRVVVFGYDDVCRDAAAAVAAAACEVAALVAPGGGTSGDPEAVRALGQALAVPVLEQPRGESSGFVDALGRLQPDAIIVWSYPRILPDAVIRVPRCACLNVHGGLLPEYRGAHVLNWAIINGETETGVTLHHIDAGIDTGDIVARASFPITREDDAATVREKLRRHGRELLATWLPRVLDGAAPRTPQSAGSGTYYRRRRPEDGGIDWTQSAVRIHDLVRALVRPWPGAFSTAANGRVTVWRTRVEPGQVDRGQPGLVLAADDAGVRVATGEGVLRILEAEVEGAVGSGRQLQSLGLTPGLVLGAQERG